MRLLILLILIITGLYSCNNNLTTIGQDLVFNGNNIEVQTTRLTETGTVKLDSFVTSSGRYGDAITQMYMGRFDDRFSGRTVAYPCFQVVPAYRPSIPRYVLLDSVTFHFTYGGKIWGDTLTNRKIQKFQLYQLSKLPELDTDDNNYFYNTDSIYCEENPLAECQFIPRTANIRSAYFKLKESDLIQDLFEKMKNGDDLFRPSEGGPVSYYKFINYFKGLAIKASEENNCILSIVAQPDSLYMRFHYHEGDDSKNFDLKLLTQTTEFQYNAIYTTPPEALSELQTQENEVLFSKSNFAIAQGLSAYLIKVELPQPPALDAYSIVIKAEIEMKPYVYSDDPVAMPSTVSVYETNTINEIKGLLYNVLPTATSAGSPVTGSFQPDAIDLSNSRYIFDITDYYQRISSQPYIEDQRYQMLLSIPNLTSSFNRMVLRELPTLRVYYANYN